MDIDKTNFFQCVRSLYLALQAEGRSLHELSCESHPSQEIVRFSVHNSLTFPAQAILKLDLPTEETPHYKIKISFMGMTGPMGVLPDHYTELVIDATHNKDSALADFFDIFHHRLILFYFLAWEKYRLHHKAEHNDKTQEYLFSSLMGLSELTHQSRLPFSDLLSFTSFFMQEPANVSNLEEILRNYLQLPVQIEQFQGHYLTLEEHRRPTIGSNGKNPQAQLGHNMMLGKRAWVEQGKIRIRIGPLTYPQFEALLPNGELAIQVVELVELYLGIWIQFDIELILLADHVPQWRIGSKVPIKFYLGWNTWLPGGPKENKSVIFVPPQIRKHAPAALRQEILAWKTKFYAPTLHDYVQKEQIYQQQQFVEYSKEHPNVGARVGIGMHTLEDPIIRSLHTQSALMFAGIRARLDDDYPEVGQTLLAEIHPEFVNPIPSVGLVQFQSTQPERHDIPSGCVIATDPKQGPICEFRTCYPVTLWPITVAHANMKSGALGGPRLPASFNPQACIHLALTCPEETTFAQLQPDTLRFFINAPREHAFQLHEWLQTHLMCLVLATDENPLFLKNHFISRGFGNDERLLPATPNEKLPHRLMQEFFMLPEKFLFFDIQNLAQLCETLDIQNELHLFFYFDKPHPLLEQHLSADWFALGCTPIINLFEKNLPPFDYAQNTDEYLLAFEPNPEQASKEIYSVQEVSTNSPTQVTDYIPQNKDRPNIPGQRIGAWKTRRQVAWRGSHFRPEGTDVFLKLFEPNDRHLNDNALVHVNVLCTNGKVPTQLFSPTRQPQFSLRLHNKKIATVHSLIAPTLCHWPSASHQASWRWLSHLKPRVQTLYQAEAGAHALAEILKNYDFKKHSGKTQSCLDGLVHITATLVVDFAPRPAPGKRSPNALSKGLEVILTVDETYFAEDGNLFLWGSILEHFLTLYCTELYFMQLFIHTKSGQQYVWPKRVGIKPQI